MFAMVTKVQLSSFSLVVAYLGAPLWDGSQDDAKSNFTTAKVNKLNTTKLHKYKKLLAAAQKTQTEVRSNRSVWNL